MSTKINKPVTRGSWKGKLFQDVRDLNKELYNGRVPDLVQGMLKPTGKEEVKIEQHQVEKARR
jgi:hypothetical protein